MWRHVEVSSLEVLGPRTAEDRHVLYGLIRDALKERFPERKEAASRLALTAVTYLGGEGARVLIRGPSESGGAAMVRCLAEVLDLPFLEVDSGALAETNWSGSDLPFLIERLRAELALRYQNAQVPELSERACILVSHLDRARLATSYSSASTREHRVGKQQALAHLLADGSIPVASDKGVGFTWRGGRALIVTTAEFADLRPGRPSGADLRSWGILPELADALASGVFIGLNAPSHFEIERRLQAHLDDLSGRFLHYGFHLRVEKQVVRYVSEVVAAGQYGGGVVAGMSWISAAAERALIRLLEEGARSGMVWVLARDDLSLPDPPKGVWRE